MAAVRVRMIRAEWNVRRTWDGSAAPASEHVHLKLVEEGGGLSLEIDAPFHDDPAPPGPPGPQPGLWEFEVVELFLVGTGERYLELEIGPHGHHWVLVLEGRRRVASEGLDLDLRVDLDRAAARWWARACFAVELLPGNLTAANAFAIHGSGDSRRHLAAYPVPGPAPDFHRLEHFPAWGGC